MHRINRVAAQFRLDQEQRLPVRHSSGRTGTDGNYLYAARPAFLQQPATNRAHTDRDSRQRHHRSLQHEQSDVERADFTNCQQCPLRIAERLMTGGQTLTISGPISITNASSTVAQTFVLTGTSLSTTIVNGLISDGGHTGSGLALGNSNPTKTTVYPAPSPTIDLKQRKAPIRGVHDSQYGHRAVLGVIRRSGTEVAGSLPGAYRRETSPRRVGKREFGYNLQTANDSITINNGVDVASISLTIDGSHSVTFGGYLYSTVNRSFHQSASRRQNGRSR